MFSPSWDALASLRSLNDAIIRPALIAHLRGQRRSVQSTLLIEELGLSEGSTRVDVALVTQNQFHGYEIKSERDTLDRLSDQVEGYSRVLDTVTLVTCENHVAKASEQVPSWWGIWLAREVKGNIKFKKIRQPSQNTTIDPLYVAKLLWKEEALQALRGRGLDKGFRSKTRNQIWERVIENFSTPDIKNLVSTSMRSRQEWRTDPILA